MFRRFVANVGKYSLGMRMSTTKANNGKLAGKVAIVTASTDG